MEAAAVVSMTGKGKDIGNIINAKEENIDENATKVTIYKSL